jgi:hypothetical protein
VAGIERLQPQTPSGAEALGEMPRELERPLARSEVREPQRPIRECQRGDSHRGVREELEGHAGADQESDAPSPKGLADCERFLHRQRPVVATHRDSGKGTARFRLESLGPPPNGTEAAPAATRTETRRRPLGATQPACERPPPEMVGRGHATRQAPLNGAALGASEGPPIAETVQDQKRRLSGPQGIGHGTT